MNNPQATPQKLSLFHATTFIIQIFSIVTEVTDLRVLLRKESVGNDLHLFTCREDELDDENATRETGYTSIEAEEAMKSHNHCVFVCKVFAGILAWLIEELRLPIRVREADIHGVIESQPVVCVDVITGTRSRIAPVHTMFKITSSNSYPKTDQIVEKDGLYLDASAPQYLRQAGLYSVKDYPVDAATAAAWPPSSTILGAAYMKHLKELHNGTRLQNFRLESIIRTVNNEVYRRINGFGRPGILAERNVEKWKAFEREILASIKARLRSLVANLDHIHIPPGIDRETHHKLIARDCFGTGHEKIIESLERVSGGVQVTRWQIF